MDFVDLSRCGRIRCLHLIRIASCKTYSLQWFRVLGASFSRFWGLRFRSRVLRFRVLGASFSSFGCFVFDLGCFVFEFWVLRFRSWVLRFRGLGASCFGLRFRVLRFRNYLFLSTVSLRHREVTTEERHYLCINSVWLSVLSVFNSECLLGQNVCS